MLSREKVNECSRVARVLSMNICLTIRLNGIENGRLLLLKVTGLVKGLAKYVASLKAEQAYFGGKSGK